MDLLIDTLYRGFPYAILALGVFITYRILDFADMTCEGSFILGGAVSLVMISNGVNPVLATMVSILAGICAGFVTGILHTKLKINGLLAGIITLTALVSVNMVIFGIQFGEPFSLFKSNNTKINIIRGFGDDPSIFRYASTWFELPKYGKTIQLGLILVAVVTLLYLFFGTEVGMSMRACGMNKKMAAAQGINTTFYVILGLCISNAIIALSGSLYAQCDLNTSTSHGAGILIIGLASIIIGEAMFGKRSFLNWIISVALGAIVYYFIVAVAIKNNFPDHLLKALYAVLIVIILAIMYVKEKYHIELYQMIKNKIFSKKKIKAKEAEILAGASINEETVNEIDTVDINTSNVQTMDVSSDTNMLEIENVVKIFNRSGNVEDIKVALNEMSVTIKEGEFVTIIGGNGSGKSTFFNTVSGVYIPDKGTIKIQGNDVTKMKEYKRAKFIGRVTQDPYQGTAQNMSILENMSIAYRRDRMKTLRWGFNGKNTEMFKEKLSELNLGLENRVNTKIGLLSGGQRQAVTLLMATLKRPDVLFLDEHTAALDPKTAKTVLELTNKIVSENHLTCVMVTHNMKDAIKYGNRLLMFNKGKVIYDVSGEEKQNLTVEELLKKFENVEFTDKDILG